MAGLPNRVATLRGLARIIAQRRETRTVGAARGPGPIAQAAQLQRCQFTVALAHPVMPLEAAQIWAGGPLLVEQPEHFAVPSPFPCRLRQVEVGGVKGAAQLLPRGLGLVPFLGGLVPLLRGV